MGDSSHYSGGSGLNDNLPVITSGENTQNTTHDIEGGNTYYIDMLRDDLVKELDLDPNISFKEVVQHLSLDRQVEKQIEEEREKRNVD